MSSRVTNTSARVTAPINNAAANAALNTTALSSDAAADNAAPVSKGRTADTANFSSPDAYTLGDLGRMVNSLERQIKALEARITSLTGGPTDNQAAAANTAPAATSSEPAANGALLPPGVNLPAYGSAQPAATNAAPAANNAAPATNNAATGNTTPAANNSAVANNATPAANAAANNAAPAANATSNVATANATPTKDRIADALRQLHELQDSVNKRVAEIEKLLRAQPTDGRGAIEKDALKNKQAGLQAISNVLADAKLKDLTPQEEAVVNPAVARVHEIGQAIAAGEDYNKYAAELFSLHQTLLDPAGAGNHPAATAAAQAIAATSEQKTALGGQLQALEAKGQLTPAEEAQKGQLQAQYKAVVDAEKALNDAKLVRLTPDAEAKALANVNKLGDVVDQLGGGKLSPADAETQIFTIGQALKAPAATSESAQVATGAEVLKQIKDGQAAIQKQLQAIDAKVIGGAAPEQFAGQRTRLLESAESLNELGDAVKGAKLEQTNPAARREVENGLAKASEIAKGLAGGEDPSKYRAETFVLKQTFQDPLESKNNPAIQSGAGALALLGRAEAANLKKQEDLAAQIAKGADPRTLDAESTRLHRQAEDLETIRHAIETPNFSGLNDAQEAQGAKLIDEIRDIGMKVANGEDFAKSKPRFDDLAKQLADLKNFGVQASGPAEDDKLEPGASYTVKSGDFLTKIAKEKFGDVNRYKDIVELNKAKYPSLAKNPDLIYPGWTLILPKK